MSLLLVPGPIQGAGSVPGAVLGRGKADIASEWPQLSGTPQPSSGGLQGTMGDRHTGVGVLEATERQGRTHRGVYQADVLLAMRKGILDGETRVHIYKGR